jgi:hypothetical protein
MWWCTPKTPAGLRQGLVSALSAAHCLFRRARRSTPRHCASCRRGDAGRRGRSEHAATPRRRKSSGAIPRREFGPRDPFRATQHGRCMPRRMWFESAPTRGGSDRVRAERDFPACGAGRAGRHPRGGATFNLYQEGESEHRGQSAPGPPYARESPSAPGAGRCMLKARLGSKPPGGQALPPQRLALRPNLGTSAR